MLLALESLSCSYGPATAKKSCAFWPFGLRSGLRFSYAAAVSGRLGGRDAAVVVGRMSLFVVLVALRRRIYRCWVGWINAGKLGLAAELVRQPP